MMSVYQGYRIGLAVLTRRILIAEVNTSDIRERLALEPNRRALKELARTKPSTLHCIAGSPYRHFPEAEGACTNVYLVAPRKILLYLGIAMSKPQADANWNHLRAIYANNSHILALLNEKGANAPIRFFCSTFLPTTDRNITPSSLSSVVHLYLDCFMPELRHVDIEWMKDKQVASDIDCEIWQRAKRRARKQTLEERMQVYLEERASC